MFCQIQFGAHWWGGGQQAEGHTGFALLAMVAVAFPECLLLQPVTDLKFKKSFHW